MQAAKDVIEGFQALQAPGIGRWQAQPPEEFYIFWAKRMSSGSRCSSLDAYNHSA